jgi:RND family efflux transporter MFP subunit
MENPRRSAALFRGGTEVNNGRRLPNLPILHTPGVPDAELLARWAAHRDEVAFELLVRRHAPAVLAACRRLLADANDADDAFQATFLVLARKAGSVARSEVLAGWLHRVAYRAALRVQAERSRRLTRQEADAVARVPAAAPPPDHTELLRVLDEEVERLPARHRAVFVLCCLEGKTGEEAALLLGCPPGTVSSRLTRARERLRNRLTRRGFAPGVLLLIASASDTLAAAVPEALVESVLGAAPMFAGSVPLPGQLPTRSTAVAEGVVRAMFLNKLKLVSAFFAIGLLAAGAVLAGAGTDPDKNPARAVPNGGDEKRPPDEKRAPAVPVVRLVKPQRGGLDRVVARTCIAEAGREIHLFPAAAGTLKRVNTELGARVRAGELLVEIDAPALLLDERQARVGVEQAESLLKIAEARASTARVEIEAAKGVVRLRQTEAVSAKANGAYRKKQFERVKELYKQNSVDAKLMEEVEEQMRAAEAQVDAAQIAVENARADLSVKTAQAEQVLAGVAAAKANVESAKVGLEKARLAVEQTRITAPFDGVVASVAAAPGQIVRVPGDQPPLVTVVRAEVLRLVVWVPESDAEGLKAGLAAEVTFDALPNRRMAGKLARVGFVVERPHKGVRAEIDLPNPKGEVLPGMTGRIALNLGKAPAGALILPAGALIQVMDPSGRTDPHTAVYVYRDGKARLTLVRIGDRNDRDVEVLAGLGADDQVVVDPTGLLPRSEVVVEVDRTAPK